MATSVRDTQLDDIRQEKQCGCIAIGMDGYLLLPMAVLTGVLGAVCATVFHSTRSKEADDTHARTKLPFPHVKTFQPGNNYMRPEKIHLESTDLDSNS
jgi:hypothetical protein